MENEGKKYDLIASSFAEMRNAFGTEKKHLDLFMQYLQPKAHILDIGCGSGNPIASYLIQNGFRVTGIDASEELLKIARKKCPAMECIYGDVRTIALEQKYDAIIEWWCLFHLPKQDHAKMIARFASWLKKGAILEFTTGDREYEGNSNDMLEQELRYYSLEPKMYEKYLRANNFKILYRKNDQDEHLVWLTKYEPE